MSTDAAAVADKDIEVSAAELDLQSPVRGSRKREREPSLEPQTPKSDMDDPSVSEQRDPRTPAKKNRLDPVDEVDSPPRSPPSDSMVSPDRLPVPPSPTFHDQPGDSEPQPVEGTKLQDIRERVQDLSWQDPNGSQEQEGNLLSVEPQDHTMRDIQRTPQHQNVILQDETPGISSGHEDTDLNFTDAPPPVTSTSNDLPNDNPDAQHKDPMLISPSRPEPTNDDAPNTMSSVPFPPLAPDVDQPPDSPDGMRRSSDSEPSDQEAGKENSRKRKLTARDSTFGSKRDFPKKPRESKASTVVEADKPEPAKPSSRPATPTPKPDDPPLVPPPVLPPSLPATSPPKLSGFAAFSAVASPFASVKGPSMFEQSSAAPAPKPKPPPSGFAAFSSVASPFGNVGANSPALLTSSVSSLGRSESSPNAIQSHPNSPKRSRSPSSSSLNRKRSPPPPGARGKVGPAFGLYHSPGTTSIGFTAAVKSHSPSPSLELKKAPNGEEAKPTSEGDDSDAAAGKTSWGEMLVTNGDALEDEVAGKKVMVEEVDVLTGEEDEATKHSVRAKLYQLDTRGAYKERGTGNLKINVRRSDDSAPRIVMRADGVYRLILNVALFPGMGCTIGPDPKYVKISSIENGTASHYAIRVGSPKAAQELIDSIKYYASTTATEDPV